MRFAFLIPCCVLFAIDDALAQAVQLPTFHYFSASTTVLVPDRGGAYMGGVNRAASSRIERGIPGLGGRPFTNRAIGSERGASGVSVHAWIHDHEEMDRAVLGAASPRASAKMPPRLIARESTPSGSVAQLKRSNEEKVKAKQDDAAALLAKGRKAVAEGKNGAAKVYFQMAARRGDEALRREAKDELAAIGVSAATLQARR
jgi:hypothetical protein